MSATSSCVSSCINSCVSKLIQYERYAYAGLTREDAKRLDDLCRTTMGELSPVSVQEEARMQLAGLRARVTREQKVPPKKMAKLLKILTYLYVQSESSFRSFPSFLDEVEIPEFVRDCFPLIVDVPTKEVRHNLLQTMACLPREQRKKVAKVALPLFHKLHDHWGRASILWVIGQLPRDNPTPLLETMAPFLRGIKDSRCYARFITTLYDLLQGESQGIEVLREASSFIAGIDILEERYLLLETIAELRVGERLEILRDVPSVIFEGAKERIAMLQAVSEIPKKDREEILSHARSFDEVLHGSTHYLTTFNSVYELQAEERGRILSRIHSCSELGLQQKWLILCALIYFPPDRYDETLALMRECLRSGAPPALEVVKVIQYVLEQRSDLREDTYNHLWDKLLSIQDKPEHARKLASEIVKHREQLLLEEKHQLFQKASAILFETSTTEMPRNPYRIHDVLTEIARHPFPPLPFAHPPESIGGRGYHVDVHHLRHKLQGHFDPMAIAPHTKEAQQFVQNLLRGKIDDLCSRNLSFIRQLTQARGTIVELPHQANYIKNMLYPMLGLRNEVLFDFHTQRLYGTLITAPPLHVLQTFLSYLTPSYLITQLKQAYDDLQDQDPEDTQSRKRRLTTAFESMAVGHELWESNEQASENQSMTKEGAMRILEAMGFLKEETF